MRSWDLDSLVLFAVFVMVLLHVMGVI